jgi:hypothetical protein
MSSSLLLTPLLVVWIAVTVVFVAVMFWKSLVGLKEEDVVILDPAEDRQAAEQQQTIARVERLASWAKRFGIASAALLVLTGGLWLYQGIRSFNGVP